MKAYLVILITTLIFSLWLLPFVAILVFKGDNGWAGLYFPIAIITAFWVYSLTDKESELL